MDRESTTSPVPAAELRFLVHDKIKQEDEAFRRKLQSLNWTVEDETTLQLLYGKEPLEAVSPQNGAQYELLIRDSSSTFSSLARCCSNIRTR